MTTYHQSGVVSHAPQAGMHRETAARYIEGRLGQANVRHRTLRTRPDP